MIAASERFTEQFLGWGSGVGSPLAQGGSVGWSQEVGFLDAASCWRKAELGRAVHTAGWRVISVVVVTSREPTRCRINVVAVNPR